MSEKDFLQQVEIALGKSDFNTVLKLSDKVLEKNPNNKLAFTYKGVAYYWLKEYDQAIAIFDVFTTKISPKKAASWYFLARCYKAKKEYPKAIELYEKSLEFNPKYLKSLKELEHLYREIKDIKNAIKIAKTGAEFYPKEFYFQYWLSILYNRNKDLVNAFHHFIEAQKLFPRVDKVKELFNALEDAYYQSASFKQRIITQENFKTTASRGNLNLSNKGIKSLDTLGLFDVLNRLLISLYLKDNKIEKITCLETATKLTTLSFSNNNIKKYLD